MSGLLACVQVVGREAAAAAVAEAEAAEQKHKHSRHKKEKRKARKEERKARKAAKRKAGDDGGAGGKRTRRGSDSDASSSSGGESDGDAPPPDARTAAGMDWMSNPAHQSAPRAAPVDEKAVAEAKAQAERDERRLALELNPNMLADGTFRKSEQDAPAKALLDVPTAGAVGDGGASWRMKALRRAQERAQEEGRTLDAVVQERWGTLASISAVVTREPAAHSRAHLRAKAERQGPDGPQPRAGAEDAGAADNEAGGEEDMGRIASSDRGYLRDVGREGAEGRRMKAPAAGASLSWRGAAGASAGAGGASAARPGDWRCPGCGLSCFAFRRECHKCGAAAPGSAAGSAGNAKAGAGRENAAVLGAMARELNTFAADGSFMDKFGGGAGAGAGGATAATAAAAAARPVDGAADFSSGQMRGAAKGLAAVADAGVGDSREVVDVELSEPDEDEPDVPAARTAPRMAPPPQAPAFQERAVPAAAPLAAGGGNASAAAALRARLLGRPAPVAAPAAADEDGDVVALPLVTADGRAAPGAFGRASAAGGAGGADPSRRPAKLQRFDAPGEKSRHYADDDSRSLRDLVAEAKHGAGGGNEYDANLARNIAKAARFKGKELDVDDEYDHDGGLDMYERKRGRGRAPEVEAQRAKAAAVADYQRAARQGSQCAFCFDNPGKPRHLHIAYAAKSYLMLPEIGRLVPGHALVLPMAHGGSGRSVDEDVADEMRNFKKCLLKMHAQAGRSVVFMETFLGGGIGQGKHCVIEAVPLPQSAAASAPMYFRKAIDEAESEWSTHAAKRCIPTGGSAAGLRGAIPAHFPYFHVEFGLREGFVHVIDEPEKWNPHFGRDVLIGLLDLPGEWTRARARRPSAPEQAASVKEFNAAWGPHDWTKQLG